MENKGDPKSIADHIHIPNLSGAETKQLPGTLPIWVDIPDALQYCFVPKTELQLNHSIGRKRAVFSGFIGFMAGSLSNIVTAISTTQFKTPVIEGAYYLAIPVCIISMIILGIFWYLVESSGSDIESKYKPVRKTASSE